MQKAFITVTVFFFSIFANAQNDSSNWFLFTDTLTGQQGYVDIQQNIRIATGKYERCFTPIFNNIAFVQFRDSIIGINKEENYLFTVYQDDSLPDRISEGLFRIVAKHKYGYANTKGEVVIPPLYDGAMPFQDGMAFVNLGAQKAHVLDDVQWQSGKWGAINKKGIVVVPIKYTNMNFQSRKGKVVRTSNPKP